MEQKPLASFNQVFSMDPTTIRTIAAWTTVVVLVGVLFNRLLSTFLK